MIGGEDDMPPLGETARDRAVSLAKGFIGAIPAAGSIIAEVVTQIIPQQRFERVEDYVRRLNERLATVEEDRLRSTFTDPENVDLFEDGALQATRALSDERRAFIVKVVADGLTGDEKAALEAKRMLRLLSEVDDDQIIILTSYSREFMHDEAFRKRHEHVLVGPRAFLGSSQGEVDAGTVSQLARAQLIQLGLLETYHPFLKKGELPEFERNGQIKGGSTRITSLGGLLLRRIGAVPER